MVNGVMHMERRLMPFLHIALGMLSAEGKMMALLWQIFLLVGPVYYDLRFFLSRVRSICTDFGTERLLANQSDMLDKFCSEVGIPIPLDAPRLDRTFPCALQAPG